MRIYYITSGLFFALFFLGVLLFDAAENNKNVADFNIIDHIDERAINGKLDVKRMINDAEQLRNFFKSQGFQRHYWQQTMDFIARSGLDLGQTYYTYDLENEGPLTIYSAIDDPNAFTTALDELKSIFDMKRAAESPNRFHSSTADFQLMLGARHVEFAIGNTPDHADTSQSSISKHCAQLLKEGHAFIINPHGTPPLDSMDYIAGDYHWDSSLNIQLNWYIEGQKHPLQPHPEKMHQYPPANDALIDGFLNIDQHQWSDYDNTFLNKNMKALNHQSAIDGLLSDHWNGQLAFQYGGTTTQERLKITADFDENFNRIQDTTIIRDTIKNAGMIVATEAPQALYEWISKQDYASASTDELQIALLPPFRHIRVDKQHLYLAASEQNFDRQKTSRIAHFHFQDEQFELTITAKNANDKEVAFTLEWTPHTETIKAASFLRNFIP